MPDCVTLLDQNSVLSSIQVKVLLYNTSLYRSFVINLHSDEDDDCDTVKCNSQCSPSSVSVLSVC